MQNVDIEKVLLPMPHFFYRLLLFVIIRVSQGNRTSKMRGQKKERDLFHGIGPCDWWNWQVHNAGRVDVAILSPKAV